MSSNDLQKILAAISGVTTELGGVKAELAGVGRNQVHLEQTVSKVAKNVEVLTSEVEQQKVNVTKLQEKFNNLETELRETREEVKVLKSQAPMTLSTVMTGRSRTEKVLTGSNLQQQVVGSGTGGGSDGAGAGRGVGEGPGDEVGARRLVPTPARQEKVEEVRKMFFEASLTLMFSPIYKDDWQAQVNTRIEKGTKIRKAEQQAGNFLVKEYLEQEMGIQGRHLEDVMDQVVEIFPKNYGDWKTLAVRFENTAVTEWILRQKIVLRTGVDGHNKPVVENWVPDGLYKRYNGVRSLAYKFRHKNNLKTQIIFGESDFLLVTRRNKNEYWSKPMALTNLPGFQVPGQWAVPSREVRSPTQAPGRQRYGGMSSRSEKRASSTSPGQSPNNKQSDQEELNTNSNMEKSKESSFRKDDLVQAYDCNVSAQRRALGSK